MISKKMQEQVKGDAVVKAMFEEGKKLRELHGADDVHDFSLGNPNTPPPQEINQIIRDILENEKPMQLHGYMSNAGYEEVRNAIAGSINKKFDTKFNSQNIVMTTGAAGGLNVIFKTLLDPDDEVVVFAPYFGEYRVYVDNYGGKLVVVPPDMTGFQLNLEEVEQKLTERTKAVIMNSPNNPTGVVYSEDTIKSLAKILEKAQKTFGTTIYLISDEPYREVVYDNAYVPYVTKYYKNTVISYSYSKSLSLPGQRIGYLVIPGEAADFENIADAAAIANRTMGFMNAPSLMQKTVAECTDINIDMSGYNKNRETLYNGLTEAGYECVKPQGAFYLFVKSPIEDDRKFCEMAKKYNILMVPGTFYACPGYVRIAYCVAHETIVNALPKFGKLINEVKLR